jgi:predicted DNA-binding ribbon-helix-helix protein
LFQIATRHGLSLAALVARIDAQRTQDTAPSRPLASALRVYALAESRGADA